MTTAPVLAGRIPVTRLTPALPDDRWRPKAFEGEVVPFRATVFREGHDQVGAMLVITSPSGVGRRERMTPMAPGTDRWQAKVLLDEVGEWHWHVTGFDDEIATWRHDAALKIDAGVDVELMYEIGARLIDRAVADKTRCPRDAHEAHRAGDGAARSCDIRRRTARPRRRPAALGIRRPPARAPHDRLPRAHDPRRAPTRGRRARGTSSSPAPRGRSSCKDGRWKSGSFRTAIRRLDGVAAMGFDVVYLPPIHPIGVTNRKGPNNTLDPGPHDPGSPWAIGGPLADGCPGGHDAVHPDLGTLADFRAFVRRADALGIEVALDLALQAAPDHPWVAEHPDWFTQLPDGTIRYAENPPKKYQDIYPVNFDDDPEGIFAEVLRVVRHWMKQGVRIFRVDNPHTKPLCVLGAADRGDQRG